MDGYQALANAIVEQAAKDYRAALHKLKLNRNNKAAMAGAMEVERFFYSRWYRQLTNVDPDYMISELRKEAVT